MTQKDDEVLFQRAEEALAEINRNVGLEEHQLAVLAALRIRLHGEPTKTLDDVLKAAGDLDRPALEELEPPKPEGSLEDLFSQPEKKVEWPTDRD